MFSPKVLQNASYALEIAKQLFHLETGKAEYFLTLLKGASVASSNTTYEYPELKEHLAVDVLSCLFQSREPNPQGRRVISGIARMAQLGISEFDGR